MIYLRMLISFFVFLSLAAANSYPITVSIHGGANFTTIQDAVDAAQPGSTIEVLAGKYRENVVLNKTLILRGIGRPVVDASGNGSTITLNADNIVLNGFVVTNSSGYVQKGMPDRFGGAGIMIQSNNNTVQNNSVILNLGCGVIIHWVSNNNTLIGNNISNNSERGIYLFGSYNNLIGNIISSNSREGIKIDECQRNVLKDNVICNNYGGLFITYLSSKNTLHNNRIFGNKDYKGNIYDLINLGLNTSMDESNLIEGIPLTEE